jgi:hypothetical protein
MSCWRRGTPSSGGTPPGAATPGEWPRSTPRSWRRAPPPPPAPPSAAAVAVAVAVPSATSPAFFAAAEGVVDGPRRDACDPVRRPYEAVAVRRHREGFRLPGVARAVRPPSRRIVDGGGGGSSARAFRRRGFRSACGYSRRTSSSTTAIMDRPVPPTNYTPCAIGSRGRGTGIRRGWRCGSPSLSQCWLTPTSGRESRDWRCGCWTMRGQGGGVLVRPGRSGGGGRERRGAPADEGRVELLSRQMLVLVQSGAIAEAGAFQVGVCWHAVKFRSRLEDPPPPTGHGRARSHDEGVRARAAGPRAPVDQRGPAPVRWVEIHR